MKARGGSVVPLYGLAAALLAVLVYANALHNPFVYDDRDTVVANPSIVDLSNVRFLLVYSPFRPVVNVSYGIDRALWGPEPFGFHLTNVLLHALSVVLVFALCLRLLGDRASSPETRAPAAERRASSAEPRTARLAAFTAASVFAVHPLFSEAVGYVSGRSEVMCAVWFLAAFLAGRAAMERGSGRWAVAAVVFGVAAALSKENAVALPVVLLAYDWLCRPGSDPARRRRLWLVFLPIVAIGAAAAIYRTTALSAVSMGASPQAPLFSGLTQSIVIWRYLGLLVWPAGQSIMHGVHRVTSLGDPLAWVAVAGLALLAAGAFLLRRREPLVTLAAIWFFGALAPSSSVIALREGMAEHRMYLAGAGLMLAIAAGASRLLSRRAEPERRSSPPAFAAGVVVVLVALGILTYMRNQVWASPVALWQEATRAAPGQWEARYALGDALREANQCDRAVPEYEQVVAAYSSHRDALTNLGICLGQTGRYEEAERAFRRTLEIDPTFARGYTNLAALALVMGDPERARDFYREAIAQDPGNVLARLQLARLYEQTFKDYHAAARMCGEVRALAPATPGMAECVERNERLAAAAGR